MRYLLATLLVLSTATAACAGENAQEPRRIRLFQRLRQPVTRVPAQKVQVQQAPRSIVLPTDRPTTVVVPLPQLDRTTNPYPYPKQTVGHHETMWKRGPMPPNTWGWGGVVPKGFESSTGFYFADFKGDHVETVSTGRMANMRVEAADVVWYTNCLTLPPRK